MKKSFLALMAVAMLGLTACTPRTKPTPTPGPQVPTEEGKITFYFEMGGGEVEEIPEYAGVFLTGYFLGSESWPTAANEVVELKNLEGTKTWYGQWQGDYQAVLAMEKGLEYQLTLGYNAESGAPSTGVNWSYKSNQCEAASGDAGLDNLSFELSADGLTANLGTHGWDKVPGPVALATNIDVQITLAEALPEYVALFAPGDYRNNWACSPELDRMTPNADRTVWTIHIDTISVGTYSMKIIAEYADCTSFSWGTVVLDNGAGDNYALMVLRGDTDGVVNINEMESVEAYTVDLTKLPDPASLTKLELTLNVAFEGSTEGFPEAWWVCGSMNGWKGQDTHLFTIAEDYKSMSVKFEVNSGTSYEYGIVASSSWAPCIKSAEGGNLTATIGEESLVIDYVVDAENCETIHDGGEAKVKGAAPVDENTVLDVLATTTAEKVEQQSFTLLDNEVMTIEVSNGSWLPATEEYPDAQLRVFKSATLKITMKGDAKLVKVELTATVAGAGKYGPGCFTAEGYTFEAEGYNGTWEGEVAELVLTASANQVRMTALSVSYK